MPSLRAQTLQAYRDLTEEARKKNQLEELTKSLALGDLYYLLLFVLDQKHMNEGPEYKRDWLFDRCTEVQAKPNEHIDIWFREGYKSTIITYGLTIQDILKNPEITVGIFSCTRPIAKAFLNQIKREFEANEKLKGLFPEVLWKNPEKEAPKWSENDGLIVRRHGNPKEATLEAWGLIDGQPTSKHFDLRVYDDVVTEESVTNAEKIQKVTKAWENSENLGKDGGTTRIAGTFYHFADTYHTMIERGAATPRIYPGTDDGTIHGRPVLYTPEYMTKKRTKMGSYTFACQVLCNPKADSVVGFDEKWLRYWNPQSFKNLNIYILVDPSSSKKKTSNDFTVMLVIGLGPDQNYYLINGLRDRLNLTEKAQRLFWFHRQYRPLKVGYEEYGLQADIEHIETVQANENYRFKITPLGGTMAKADRIEKLEPEFRESHFYIPTSIIQVNHLKVQEDLVKIFIREEYNVWPYALHDDILDAMARIKDPELKAVFPQIQIPVPPGHDRQRNQWDPLRE